MNNQVSLINDCSEMGKWDTMDYSQRNMIAPGAILLEQGQHGPIHHPGIPLRFAPQAPKRKKTWVKKEGTITQYFQDFVGHIAQAFIHKQLDKLTADIHRCNVVGIDADSKHLLLHCDFSQDLSHAMTDQSMCKYFDIISSSLFSCCSFF